MKKSLEEKLIDCDQKIYFFRKNIHEESNIAVKNVYISLTNDQVSRKNRIIEYLCFDEKEWVDNKKQGELKINKENKDILKSCPEMLNILTIRNLYNIDYLVKMAESIKSEPVKIMEIEEYPDYLPT